MKRILAACVLLMAGAWASAQVNGQGGVYINGVLQTAVSWDYLHAGGISMSDPTTDVVPDPLLLKAADAWPGATTNTTGADTILAGGIGRRIFTVVDYSHGSMADSTVTVTINGAATVLTEGIEWDAETSNYITADNLAAAIEAVSGVSAVTNTKNIVRITPDVGTYSLTIAKSADDAGMTATSGTDGSINIASKSAFPFLGLGGGEYALTIDQSAGNAERCIYAKAPYYGVGLHGYSQGAYGVWGETADGNALRGTATSSGYALYADGPVKIVGNVTSDTAAITAVGTAAANGYIRTGVYKRAWTNAEVTAFGAVLSGDLKVATLPAKAVVRNAYLVIDSQASGTTTLTASLGRTATAYVDYILAGDAKVAANSVYGDVVGERGSNLTGYDLPSYVAAVDVYVQFVATDVTKKLEDVLGCTGTVYLLTETLP